MDPHHLAQHRRYRYRPCSGSGSDECVANFNASNAHIAALERYVAQLEQFLLPGAAAHSSQAQAFLLARRNHFLATRLSARNTLEMYRMAAQQRQQRQQQQQQHPINPGVGEIVSLDRNRNVGVGQVQVAPLDRSRSYNRGLNPYPYLTPTAVSPITIPNAHHDLGRMPPPTPTSPSSTRAEDGAIVPSIVPSCSLQLPDSNDNNDTSSANTFHEGEEPDSDDDDDSSSPSLNLVSTRMDNNSLQQQRSHDTLGVPAYSLLPQQNKLSFCSTSNARKPFPVILMEILSREDITHIVSWCSHGRAWIVHQPKALECFVLAHHFKHSKFLSFMRQVNGWGFQRIQHGKDKNAYYHEKFLRGRRDLCKTMRRNAAPGVYIAPPNFYHMEQIAEC